MNELESSRFTSHALVSELAKGLKYMQDSSTLVIGRLRLPRYKGKKIIDISFGHQLEKIVEVLAKLQEARGEVLGQSEADW